jgi:uncharacterized protein (TIGR04255 family)
VQVRESLFLWELELCRPERSGGPLNDWLTQEPEDLLLGRPQLSTVVCQIRHEQEMAASDPSRALRVCEALEWADDLSESLAQELNIVTGGSGAAATPYPAIRGWQMRSEGGAWIATVMPDHFSLETRSYSNWHEFSKRMTGLVEAVAKHIGPSLEQRTGLRFVNHFQEDAASSPSYWAGRISSEIFQEQLYDGLGRSLRAALQVLEIQTLDGLILVMRHGCQQTSSDGYSYVLDNDCSRLGSRALERDMIASTMEMLHRLALQAFEMATTRQLRNELRGG